ncbi:hypothetical protein GN330_09930 [Nitratireductor sp. CAU 1489]|uniref:SPOR domain-containing protein n=1 Tax=Nitratireductor arenosus TaxID=2682096 RepID=A0A844QHR7_9HYPH|nr:SPOR domain-containing protein [Nitratireductor arenosus]MVA97563.1 hypothetical protein [Nitratireductor arenosus]
MADLKQLKVKHDDDFAENDPLAELTRIMGGMPQATGAGEVDDDFGIDLERELMGELEQDVEPYARHPLQPREPAPDEHVLPDLGQSFEDELAAEFSASLESVGDMGEHEDVDRDAPAYDQTGYGARAYDSPVRAQAGIAPPTADFDRADDEAAFVDMNFTAAPAEPASGPVRAAGQANDFLTAQPRHGLQEPASDVAADAGITRSAGDDEPVGWGGEPDAAIAGREQDAAPTAPATNEPVFDPFAELAAMALPPAAPEPERIAEASPRARSEVPGEQEETQEWADVDFGEIRDRDAAIAEASMTVEPDPVGQAEIGPGASETDPRPLWADRRFGPSDLDDVQDDVLAHMELGFEQAAPRADRAAQPVAFDGVNPVEMPVEPEVMQSAWQDDHAVAQMPVEPAAPNNDTSQDAADLRATGDADWTQAQSDRADFDAVVWNRPQPVQAATHVARADQAPPAETPRAGFARAAEAPAIETMDVPEGGVEIADETGIPELVQEDEPRLDLADELDMEFASAFEELNRDKPGLSEPQGWSRATDAASLAAERRVADEAAHDDFALGLDETDLAIDDTFDFGGAEPDYDDGGQWRQDGFDDAPGQEAMAAEWPDEAYQVHATDETELASAFHGAAPHADAAEEAPRSGRRGLMIAALVAGVAVVGGISAFALSWGSGDPEAAPAMVKADPSPVKVRPETPGGVTVPNEDKIVYERVAGGDEPGAPAQEKLLSAAEEPVDLVVRDVTPVAPDEADAAPGKSEDRIAPETSNLPGVAGDEPALVTPRRVRTMIVKPDGTLVPRDEPLEVATAAEVEPVPAPLEPPKPAPEPVAAVPAPEPVAPAPEAPVAQDGVGNAEASDNTAAPAPAEADSAPVRVVETTTIRQSGTQKVPDRGPVAPTRPSDQPVEIVGNTRQVNRETQVAALDTQAPKPGEWSMQIASQPSPEGAQQSYVNLAGRYGSILKGRGVNIVKADIAGKGTFWRVRIPAGSRAEATSLCEQYKAAGGSCFVAK